MTTNRPLSARLARHILARIRTNVTAMRHIMHLHAESAQLKADTAIIRAETSRIRDQIGHDNENFRGELVLYLLDYNRIARQDIDLITGILERNGHALPYGLNLEKLQTAFTDLCETAAVYVSNLPENPMNLVAGLDAHLRNATPQTANAETYYAHQMIHILLGGSVNA